MHTYWIILIPTLIPTLNVPIYKFKYQSMFDHHANQQHLSDHHANIIQLSKVNLMYNTVVYMYSYL